MWKAVFLLCLALIAAGAGNICLAKGMQLIGPFDILQVSQWFAVLFHPYIIAGIFLELLYFSIWLIVLSISHVSWAVPMHAIEYVFVVILSIFLLGESVSWQRWIGIGCIMIGIVFMMRSWEKEKGDLNEDEHTAG